MRYFIVLFLLIFQTKENVEKRIKNSHTLGSKLLRRENFKIKYKRILKNDMGLDLVDYDGMLYTILCDKKHNHTFQIVDTLLYSRKKFKNTCCTICNPIGSLNDTERELITFIENIQIGDINIILKDRNLIKPLELDIYIPSHNLAIEYNGVYWHSETFRDNKYHRNKYDRCKNIGIDLLSIWEDDWINNKDIIKDIIRKRLQIQPSNIYYARKTIIKIPTIEEEIEFLNNNHIHGYIVSKYSYGLYIDNELISMMTFSERVITIDNNDIEMLRYAIKIDCGIIGGAEKLFNNFLKNTEYKNIKSFCDPCYFKGDVYEKLGFEYNNISEPSYFYVKNYKRFHRRNFTIDKLIKDGFDTNQFTEKEIMLNRGYLKIWDIGQKSFYYKR